MKHRISEKQLKIISGFAVAFFIVFMAVIAWYAGRPLVRFADKPELFRAWVGEKGFIGRLAFIGIIVFQIVIAIVPGEPFEIAAGYTFGVIEGTVLCIIGQVIGSALVFLFVRYCGRHAVELFFPREKIESLKFLKNTKRLNILVFILFFIPGTPKDIMCYFVGLTKMKLADWLMITAIARIPSVITSTVGGDALGVGKFGFAVIVFVFTGMISVCGILVYRYICKRQNRNDA